VSSTTTAVLAEGLRKRYGRTAALDGFDLAVPAGSVCGLLGPNGAGKTTAVRILTTLLRADGGRAQVAGFDVAGQAAQVRYRIGLLGQNAAVDEVLGGGRTWSCSAGSTTSEPGPPVAAPTSCSTSSGWATPEASRSSGTRAGCGGGSTWRPA
jgi:ABC-type multidrug transport system ATPase subunit